jgi:hypothetical protein
MRKLADAGNKSRVFGARTYPLSCNAMHQGCIKGHCWALLCLLLAVKREVQAQLESSIASMFCFLCLPGAQQHLQQTQLAAPAAIDVELTATESFWVWL